MIGWVGVFQEANMELKYDAIFFSENSIACNLSFQIVIKGDHWYLLAGINCHHSIHIGLTDKSGFLLSEVATLNAKHYRYL